MVTWGFFACAILFAVSSAASMVLAQTNTDQYLTVWYTFRAELTRLLAVTCLFLFLDRVLDYFAEGNK